MSTLIGCIRRLPGGGRAAESIIRLADARNQSLVGALARQIGGLPSHPVPTYWWSAEPNFGDMLSSVIVQHMSRGTPVLVSKNYEGKLLAVGSIIHRVAKRDLIWGSGSISEEIIRPPTTARFFAVRGPLTRRSLQADVPEIYGDPVMLLPRVYSPRRKKQFRVGIVPHLVDGEALDVKDPSILKIDVRAIWSAVVDRIVSCDLILSSSLHGLIVAEAYGVPAAWVTVTGRVKGGGFKFRDYYLSTDRDPPSPIPWRKALSHETRYLTFPPRFDTRPLVDAWPPELTPFRNSAVR
jgi:pyruvyltransferase